MAFKRSGEYVPRFARLNFASFKHSLRQIHDVGTVVLRNAKSTVNIFGTVKLTLIYVLWVDQNSWHNWPNLPPESVRAKVTSF